MDARQNQHGRWSWCGAALLSIALHGLLILLFLLVPRQGTGNGGRGLFKLDTRTDVPAVELLVVLGEPQHAPVNVGSTPPPIPGQTPQAPKRLSPEAPHTVARAEVPTRLVGSTEEQDWNQTERVPIEGNAGGPNGTSPGKTPAFFNIATAARSVVYVIDRSASMGQDGVLAAAKRELLISLGNLQADCRFQVIAYNKQAQPFLFANSEALVPATAENKRQAVQLIQELTAEGGTDHERALFEALNLRPEVIFFLTDAGDLSAQQIRRVTQRNQRRSIINTIELAAILPRVGERTLHLLASTNGGEYRAERVQP